MFITISHSRAWRKAGAGILESVGVEHPQESGGPGILPSARRRWSSLDPDCGVFSGSLLVAASPPCLQGSGCSVGDQL